MVVTVLGIYLGVVWAIALILAAPEIVAWIVRRFDDRRSAVLVRRYHRATKITPELRLPKEWC